MVEDVADYLRCSKDAVYRMVERQEIPHTRIFKRKGLRFRPEEIEEWLRSQAHAKES
jgi:excisionase family DNA binding protein